MCDQIPDQGSSQSAPQVESRSQLEPKDAPLPPGYDDAMSRCIPACYPQYPPPAYTVHGTALTQIEIQLGPIQRPDVVAQRPAYNVDEQPQSAKRSFHLYIVFACLTFWCCGMLLGGIAFILAVLAAEKDAANNRTAARNLRRLSICFSTAGILVGVLVAILVPVFVFVIWPRYSSWSCGNSYYLHGFCYRYRSDFYTKDECRFYTGGSYYRGFCYYN